jgi:hypothetical protein
MSFYQLQDGMHSFFDRVRAQFYWAKDKHKQKYHMVKWAAMCAPKEAGGLGFTNTRILNHCLMAKWAWKVFNDQGGLWLEIMRRKYLQRFSFAAVRSSDGSQLWKAILRARSLIRLGARHIVGNGRNTLFWQDRWIHQTPLAELFPSLFEICSNPEALVADILNRPTGRPIFRRTLCDEVLVMWRALQALVGEVFLNDEPDRLTWTLDPSGCFTTASLYKALHEGAAVFPFKELWTLKLPLKIKHFIWQLARGRLPSGTQVQKRRGPRDGLCPLCREPEDQNHIIFNCSLARFTWACFRECLGCTWAPRSFHQFFSLLSGISGHSRKMLWLTFAAIAWSLWTS